MPTDHGEPQAGSGWENSLKMKFVRVPHGSFWMGGGGGQPGDRQVEIGHDFYLGVHPVTQAEWQAVMGNNPSHFSRHGGGKDKVKQISDEDLKHFPVEFVSWDEIQKFIEQLNAREKNSGWVHRLPTEAEWEYACRGGAPLSKQECSFHFFFKNQPTNDLSSREANFDGNYPDGGAGKGPYLERTTRVGSCEPNRLGLFDMHGNVWEWCTDLWEQERSRVFRGGCWCDHGDGCRASTRNRCQESCRWGLLGFRLALDRSGSGQQSVNS